MNITNNPTRRPRGSCPEPVEGAELPSTGGCRACRGTGTVEGLAQAPLWGMGKVIALEHPELSCTLVDLDPATTGNNDIKDAQALWDQMQSQTNEGQVAFRDGKRYVARLARHQSPIASKALDFGDASRGSYLITGGLGGLGLLIARFLVEQGARHLVLISRSEPSPAHRNQLRELEEDGARILVAQADVSQYESLAQVIAKIELPLAGVIHAAGVLADGLLQQQSWEHFSDVLAPKVQGAWHLHQLTSEMPLDFFVLFSSAASLLGSAGQANHAAANAFLDSLAFYRRSLGLPALSINWGAWSEVGAAARRQVDTARKGMGSIAPSQGLEVLAHFFSLGTVKPGQVGVVPIKWDIFKSQDPFLGALPKGTSDNPATHQTKFRQQLKAKAPDKRRSFLMAHVRAIVGEVLGTRKPIPLLQGFSDMGMDSLMSIELKNRLQTSLEYSLPPTLIFKYPTLEALVDYLAQELLPNIADKPESLKGEEESAFAQLTEERYSEDDEIEASIQDKLTKLEILLKDI